MREAETGFRLDLPEHLDGAAAGRLLEPLRLACHADVALNGSAVRKLGGLGLQLLLSARKTLVARGFRLVIETPSEALTRDLVLFGALSLLEGAAS